MLALGFFTQAWIYIAVFAVLLVGITVWTVIGRKKRKEQYRKEDAARLNKK